MNRTKHALTSTTRSDLDPLDLELVERALERVFIAVKESGAPNRGAEALDDEALEVALRRELIEIARWHGVSDPETLHDLLLAHRSQE